jgi:hypothetical protein
VYDSVLGTIAEFAGQKSHPLVGHQQGEAINWLRLMSEIRHCSFLVHAFHEQMSIFLIGNMIHCFQSDGTFESCTSSSLPWVSTACFHRNRSFAGFAIGSRFHMAIDVALARVMTTDRTREDMGNPSADTLKLIMGFNVIIYKGSLVVGTSC